MLKQEYKHKIKKLRKQVLSNKIHISALQSFMDKYKRFNLRKRSRIISRVYRKISNENK